MRSDSPGRSRGNVRSPQRITGTGHGPAGEFGARHVPAGRPTAQPASRCVPRERQLLADLADQAAIAFRGIQLTAELAGEVEQLRHRAAELAESRRSPVGCASRPPATPTR